MKLKSNALTKWFITTMVSAFFCSQIKSDDFYELGPIYYSKSPSNNIIDKLNELIKGKSYKTQLELLDVLLDVLDIPVESQVLVFSKTSAQKDKISIRYPRAIYYNDSTYLAFVQGGDFEIITHDNKLGFVFYTVERNYLDKTTKPLTVKRQESCLRCHASSISKSVPGLFLRSVYTDKKGVMDFTKGGFDVSDEQAIVNRWGGWYVTGYWGQNDHLGNGHSIPRDLTKLDNLKGIIDQASYPKSTSDLAALMVLEHQCKIHNTFVSAKLYYERSRYLSLALDPKSKADDKETASYHMAEKLAEEIVSDLLFEKESPIENKAMQGGKPFVEAFAKSAKRSSTGKHLRGIRLYKRLFSLRCSYMIHSPAFLNLPSIIKELVYKNLYIGLNAEQSTGHFKHLKNRERGKILQILMETTPIKKFSE